MEFITLSLHGFRICLFQRYSHTWTQKNFTISSYFQKLKTKSVRISKVHYFPTDNVLYTGSLLVLFPHTFYPLYIDPTVSNQFNYSYMDICTCINALEINGNWTWNVEIDLSIPTTVLFVSLCNPMQVFSCITLLFSLFFMLCNLTLSPM